MHRLLLLLLLSGSALANTGYYRWQDADGRLHYGDRPPAGAQHVPAGTAPLSIIDMQLPTGAPLRHLVEAELQRERANRLQAQREAAQEEQAKQRLCDGLRRQREQAETDRRRSG